MSNPFPQLGNAAIQAFVPEIIGVSGSRAPNYAPINNVEIPNAGNDPNEYNPIWEQAGYGTGDVPPEETQDLATIAAPAMSGGSLEAILAASGGNIVNAARALAARALTTGNLVTAASAAAAVAGLMAVDRQTKALEGALGSVAAQQHILNQILSDPTVRQLGSSVWNFSQDVQRHWAERAVSPSPPTTVPSGASVPVTGGTATFSGPVAQEGIHEEVFTFDRESGGLYRPGQEVQSNPFGVTFSPSGASIEADYDTWLRNLPYGTVYLGPHPSVVERVDIPTIAPAGPIQEADGAPNSPGLFPDAPKPDAYILGASVAAGLAGMATIGPTRSMLNTPQIAIPTHDINFPGLTDILDGAPAIPNTTITVGPASHSGTTTAPLTKPLTYKDITAAGAIEIVLAERLPSRGVDESNRLRNPKGARKPWGALGYLAMLRLVNGTFGKLTEVADFTNILRSSMFVDPGKGNRLVVRAESIKNPGTYYDVVISSKQNLYSLPVNVQKEIFKGIADGRLGNDMWSFDADMFAKKWAFNEIQDMSFAMGSRGERAVIRALGLDKGLSPLAFGNITTWANRVKQLTGYDVLGLGPTADRPFNIGGEVFSQLFVQPKKK